MEKRIGLFVLATCVLFVEGAAAQNTVADRAVASVTNVGNAARYGADAIRNRIYSEAVPQYWFSNVNRGMFQSSSTARRSKPFSSMQTGSSVSPYLGLSQPFTSSATNYYTQVRPQIEQQRAQEAMQRQIMQQQRQMGQYAVQGPYSIRGSERYAPTGHAAVFMNYGGYYPQPAPPRR
ncbi:MAG: hypothetical protein KDA61_18375 [Planctomycetales bacterium]|nr:hypothetical protein [Planctomycetales bacterium]